MRIQFFIVFFLSFRKKSDLLIEFIIRCTRWTKYRFHASNSVSMTWIWRNFFSKSIFFSSKLDAIMALTEKPGRKKWNMKENKIWKRKIHSNDTDTKKKVHSFLFFLYKTFSCFLPFKSIYLDDKLLYLSKHAVHRRYRHA